MGDPDFCSKILNFSPPKVFSEILSKWLVLTDLNCLDTSIVNHSNRLKFIAQLSAYQAVRFWVDKKTNDSIATISWSGFPTNRFV